MQDEENIDEVRLVMVDMENLGKLKLLNSVLFPIAYSDKFYRDCTSYPEITQLAYKGEELAGAIACRLEDKGDHAKLYIMTLGVLAPFRRQGIASKLLQRSLSVCMDEAYVTDAYLHVQCGNDDVIQFYKVGMQFVQDPHPPLSCMLTYAEDGFYGGRSGAQLLQAPPPA
jgi:N-alpha-acetyltransferase 50